MASMSFQRRNGHASHPMVDRYIIAFFAVCCIAFFDPEGGSQKATLLVVGISYPGSKNPKAFLIRSGTQRNFAYTFMLTFPADYHLRFFAFFVLFGALMLLVWQHMDIQRVKFLLEQFPEVYF